MFVNTARLAGVSRSTYIPKIGNVFFEAFRWSKRREEQLCILDLVFKGHDTLLLFTRWMETRNMNRIRSYSHWVV